jgi:Holliday junction resolvase
MGKNKNFPDLSHILKHSNKKAIQGAQFEHRVMKWLRQRGWHCMRRTFSWGVVFCGFCGNNVSRSSKKCGYCASTKQVLHASLDVTAYKNGVYLLITCKHSKYKDTTYKVDTLWQNMIPYANLYGAIPVFAGVKNRHIRFTNLLTLTDMPKEFFEKPFLNFEKQFGIFTKGKYKHPSTTKLTAETAKKLSEEAWKLIGQCNTMIEDKAGKLSPSEMARWAAVKVQMIDKIVKLETSGGGKSAAQDLANMLSNADGIAELMEKEEKEAKEKQKDDKKSA